METISTDKKPKKDNAESSQPVKVIRYGAIAASIWQRQSPAGFAYFDFSISRSWKSLSSGRTGYSSNFFAQHGEELTKVIAEASVWIEANSTEEQQSAAQGTLAA